MWKWQFTHPRAMSRVFGVPPGGIVFHPPPPP
jgi:hypothetical protein